MRKHSYEFVNIKGKDFIKFNAIEERRDPNDNSLIIFYQESWELLSEDTAMKVADDARGQLMQVKKNLPKRPVMSAEDKRFLERLQRIEKHRQYEAQQKQFGTHFQMHVEKQEGDIEYLKHLIDVGERLKKELKGKKIKETTG